MAVSGCAVKSSPACGVLTTASLDPTVCVCDTPPCAILRRAPEYRCSGALSFSPRTFPLISLRGILSQPVLWSATVPKTISPETFGSRLRALRGAANLTRAALAAKCGLHLVHLAKLEADVGDPKFSSVHAIADALGVSVAEFPPPKNISTKRTQ